MHPYLVVSLLFVRKEFHLVLKLIFPDINIWLRSLQITFAVFIHLLIKINVILLITLLLKCNWFDRITPANPLCLRLRRFFNIHKVPHHQIIILIIILELLRRVFVFWRRRMVLFFRNAEFGEIRGWLLLFRRVKGQKRWRTFFLCLQKFLRGLEGGLILSVCFCWLPWRQRFLFLNNVFANDILFISKSTAAVSSH